MHQKSLAKERESILSDRAVRELIQSRIQTVGLLASQTDSVVVVAEELLRLRKGKRYDSRKTA